MTMLKSAEFGTFNGVAEIVIEAGNSVVRMRSVCTIIYTALCSCRDSVLHAAVAARPRFSVHHNVFIDG